MYPEHKFWIENAANHKKGIVVCCVNQVYKKKTKYFTTETDSCFEKSWVFHEKMQFISLKIHCWEKKITQRCLT
jgi:hypothetical protein